MNQNTNDKRKILPVLFLGVLMAALDIALVATTLPSIRAAFQLDERTASWILGAFVLFNVLGLPLMAVLSDLYGRRRIYVMDVLLFAGGAILVIMAPNVPVLLAGRCLQGLGASGIFPVASAMVGDVMPVEKRGRALGILGAVFGIAFIIGPIIGGILVAYGWFWPFVVNLGLAGCVFILSLLRLPDTRSEKTKVFDWKGVSVLGILLLSFSYGINQVQTESGLDAFANLRVWPALLLALLLVPLFIRIEKQALNPLLRLDLMRKRQVVLVSLFAVGAGLTEAAFVFMADFATLSFDVQARTASFMLLPLVFAVALGSPTAGRLLDRIGSRPIIQASYVAITAGFLIMGAAATTRTGFYGGSVLIGLGLSGILGSSLRYILLNEARTTERTVAQGIVTLFISLGQLTGAVLIGAIAASEVTGVRGYMQAFNLLALLGAVLFVLSFLLKKKETENQVSERV